MSALIEFVRATANLWRAKARAAIDPCPPHEYDDGVLFCRKCGEYR